MLNLKDASMNVSGALPNGAAATTTTSIDLGLTVRGELAARTEFELAAPALNTTQQPDAKTMIYDIIISDNADLSSPVMLYPSVLTQTGAGAAGAAAAKFRFRTPLQPGGAGASKRYIGARATGSGAGSARFFARR